MNAQELRINNWVSRTDGVQVQLSNIGRKGTNIGPDESPVYLEWHMFQPIPITPEILEKCGFEFDKGTPYDTTYFGVDMIEKDLHFYWGGTELSFNDFGNVKHLHQLQNLYYALTGEELTYNAQ